MLENTLAINVVNNCDVKIKFRMEHVAYHFLRNQQLLQYDTVFKTVECLLTLQIARCIFLEILWWFSCILIARCIFLEILW
jgi:hypothetical protein